MRAQVLHTLCDGSPVHLEDAVIDAVRSFNGDDDKDIRRRANKASFQLKTTPYIALHCVRIERGAATGCAPCPGCDIGLANVLTSSITVCDRARHRPRLTTPS